MKEIAIIGVTASGKSDLALSLARKYQATILSLDSLAIYKEIDIVSAKPSLQERQGIKHFGIDLLYPNEYFSVEVYLRLYQEAKTYALNRKVPLIIVGGTSFYLKRLIEGLSPLPPISSTIQTQVKQQLKNLPLAYKKLHQIDPLFASRIAPKDRYRIEKGLTIYYATKTPPSLYLAQNPPRPVTNPKIFEITLPKEELRERVFKRTWKMVEKGLIKEVYQLQKTYTRSPRPFKAIGIKESLEYLDGKIKTLPQLVEQISTHTLQLAKRQRVFNKTQFLHKIALPQELLKEEIEKELER